MELGIKGKNALVTGGTHGIGLEIAKVLLGEGCNVAVCSRDPTKAMGELVSVSGGGDTFFLKCDVLRLHEIDRVMHKINIKWGGVDVLVNNVGGGGRWGNDDPVETSHQVWMDVLTKNFHATRLFTMLALPAMVRKRWGRVVTIASMHGREAGGRPWFVAAKAAQIALMKSLADYEEYVRANITFNSVALGPVLIEGTGWYNEAQDRPDEYAEYVSHLSMGRLGCAYEVAAVVAFLCSQQASWVNGACIAVDGGQGRAF